MAEKIIINGVTVDPRLCRNATKDSTFYAGRDEDIKQSVRNVVAQLEAWGMDRVQMVRKLPGFSLDSDIVTLVDEDIRAAMKILGRTNQQHMRLCEIWKARLAIELANARLPPNAQKAEIPEIPPDLKLVCAA